MLAESPPAEIVRPRYILVRALEKRDLAFHESACAGVVDGIREKLLVRSRKSGEMPFDDALVEMAAGGLDDECPFAGALPRFGKPRKADRGDGAFRNSDGDFDSGIRPAPLHADFAALDGVARLHPVESRVELRLDGERRESGRCALDPGQPLVEPIDDIRHHEVVERRILAAVPRLVACRVALGDHVSVAGLRVVGRHFVDHVAAAVLHQRLQEIRIADFARADGAAPSHVLHDVGDYRRRLAGIRKAESESDRVRSLRVVLVAVFAGFPPLSVERLLYVRGLLAERRGLRLPAEQIRALRERLRVQEIERRGGEVVGRPARGTLVGRDGLLVPVAETAGRYEESALFVPGLRADVLVVGDHVFPVFAYERIVARPFVLLPRNLDDGRTPFDRVAETALEDGVFGRDVRHHAVRKLRVGKVAARLGEQRLGVPAPSDLVGVDVVLLLPAELFAVRTVGEHALHVGTLRPPADVVDFVEELERTLEGAGRRRVRHHDARFGIHETRQSPALLRLEEPHLHVAETIVEERRLERFVARAGEGERAARDRAVVSAGILRYARLARAKRNLRKLDFHAARARTRRDDLRNIGRVLSEIDRQLRVRHLHDAHRLPDLLQAASERSLDELPGGRRNASGLFALRLRRGKAAVDVVAAIHVRAHHLARRNRPAAGGRLHRAADDQLLRALAACEFRVKPFARRFDVVHPVAEGYFERVFLAGFEDRRKHVVEARLRRARPAREIELVAAAERPAVQRGDVLSEPADRYFRRAVLVSLERCGKTRRGRIHAGRLADPLGPVEKPFRHGRAVRGECREQHDTRGEMRRHGRPSVCRMSVVCHLHAPQALKNRCYCTKTQRPTHHALAARRISIFRPWILRIGNNRNNR